MFRNIISYWIRSIISNAYGSASDEVCRSVRPRHKVRKIATLLLFRRNCTVQQILKAGTSSSQSTFSVFYLWDVTHRHMDTFSVGPVVAAQEVV